MYFVSVIKFDKERSHEFIYKMTYNWCQNGKKEVHDNLFYILRTIAEILYKWQRLLKVVWWRL